MRRTQFSTAGWEEPGGQNTRKVGSLSLLKLEKGNKKDSSWEL